MCCRLSLYSASAFLLGLLSSTSSTRVSTSDLLTPQTGFHPASSSTTDTSQDSILHHDRALNIAYGWSSPSMRSRFPYAVLIAFHEGSSGRVGICGGTMIDSQWLLTAGSCIGLNRRLFVSIGESKLSPSELIDQEEADLVEAEFVYEDFKDDAENGMDIGLLHLKTPQDVPFPKLPSDESSLAFGLKLVGLGRGITDINGYFSNALRVASSFVYYDMETCMQQWIRTEAEQLNNMICVGGEVFDGSQGICPGDEGGALIQVEPGSYDLEESDRIVKGDAAKDVLYGIASFGPPDCGSEGFSFYTSVYPYLDWINQTMANYTPPTSVQHSHNVEMQLQESNEDMNWMIWMFICAGLFLVVAATTGIVCRRTRTLAVSCCRGKSAASIADPTAAMVPTDRSSIIQISPFLVSTNAQNSGKDLSSESSCEAPPLPGSLNANIRVELLGRKIGSGAFGQVEEGLYTDTDGTSVQVAVKSINLDTEDSKSALLNEMRVFERVGHHPNIVRCYGGKLHSSMEDPAGYYLAMELMVSDLGKLLKDQEQRQKLTFGQYLHIFYGIAKGLEHLHNSDVVHFDLKPSNVLLDAEHNPKLADFGCSRKRAHSYITAGVRGTMAYMAPELWILGMYGKKAQVRAEKLDVFSYGVVMWETLTNQTPLDPLNVQELLSTRKSHESDSMVFQDRSDIEINSDFRTNRFPLMEDRYPIELKELMWDCLSYFNDFRPDISGIKSTIEKMLNANWIEQHIDNYMVTS